MAYSQKRLHNFYHKFKTSQREHIELYIGRTAGKQLSEDLKSAKNEVIILTPYIDQEKVTDLIKLSEEGVNINLAFTDIDHKKDSHQQLIKSLTSQEKKVDTKLKAKKSRDLSQNRLYIIFSFLGIALSLLLTNYFVPEYFDRVGLILPFAAILLLSSLFKKRNLIKGQATYTYEYVPKINFKILNDSSDDPQVHSKIFLFDQQIAYLGSLNFADSGFRHNFETLIRVTKSRQIKELSDFASSFFDGSNSDLCKGIQEICSKVYEESSDNNLSG